MKKIALFALIFIVTFTSCSLDDGNNTPVRTEVMPIESVEMPEYFVHGENYEILITYNRPSSCYQFYDFYYDINEHERTVAVVNTVYESASCIEELEPITVTLNFMVNGTETYIFKFFQGEVEGVDQYYLVEVPVMDERAVSDGIVKD